MLFLGQADTYGAVKELGAWGLILLALAAFFWRGLPMLVNAINEGWKRLIGAFEAQVQKEREFGADQLRQERESREHSEERMTAAIDRNTQAIERNTASNQALEKVVQESLVRKTS